MKDISDMTKSYSQQKMFIEQILEVDTLVFKSPSELKKVKYDKIKLFESGWQNIALPKPPANSSKQTLDEIKLLQKETSSADDDTKRAYINCDKDASYYIKEVLSENNYDYNEDTIEYIENQCRPIIKHYKNHYNRPRPYQVAEFLNLKLDSFKTESSKTPSYPSGHTVQPYVVANYYGKLYPEVAEDLRNAADICAYGRIEAGLHFPSDYRAGIYLADELINYLKFDTINEEAPVNSTGTAVSTDTPLVKSRGLYRRKNLQYTKHLDKLLQKRYN